MGLKKPHFKDENINETYALHSQLDLPFLSTPEYLIRKILQKINLKKNAVIYDLGSGDGRVIKIAAEEFGLFAIGFEINPHLYLESINMLNSLSKNFRKNTQIYKKDLYGLNLEAADCVFVYNTPKGTKLLKHVLLTAKIGTIFIFIRFELQKEIIKECKFELFYEMTPEETKIQYPVFFFKKKG